MLIMSNEMEEDAVGDYFTELRFLCESYIYSVLLWFYDFFQIIRPSFTNFGSMECYVIYVHSM
jgi:hypothetical protein